MQHNFTLPKSQHPPTPESVFTTICLPKHASELTCEQRSLLDAIWQSQWSLDKPFPKRGLPLVIGKRPFEEVVGCTLNGLVVETHEGGDKCYALTIHGALFSSEGSTLLSLLSRLAALVKSMYETDHLVKQVSHEVLQAHLELSSQESLQLATLLQCRHLYNMPFYFSGRSHDRLEWSITITDEITELFQAPSSEQYLNDRLSSSRTHALIASDGSTQAPADGWPLASSWWTDASTTVPKPATGDFVTRDRLAVLRDIRHAEYDCTRLISLCEELNDCAGRGNANAVSMLTRAVLDHVAPAFGYAAFKQVASNYGGLSFKHPMERLEQHTRKVADRLLHTPIRQKELAPTMKEVAFSAEVEMLLAEFCRVLKK